MTSDCLPLLPLCFSSFLLRDLTSIYHLYLPLLLLNFNSVEGKDLTATDSLTPHWEFFVTFNPLTIFKIELWLALCLYSLSAKCSTLVTRIIIWIWMWESRTKIVIFHNFCYTLLLNVHFQYELTKSESHLFKERFIQ